MLRIQWTSGRAPGRVGTGGLDDGDQEEVRCRESVSRHASCSRTSLSPGSMEVLFMRGKEERGEVKGREEGKGEREKKRRSLK